MTTRPEAAPTLSDAGKKGGRGKKASNDHNGVSRGDNPEYLAARIARDAPEVLEDMKAGKYPSVRAAAASASLKRACQKCR